MLRQRGLTAAHYIVGELTGLPNESRLRSATSARSVACAASLVNGNPDTLSNNSTERCWINTTHDPEKWALDAAGQSPAQRSPTQTGITHLQGRFFRRPARSRGTHHDTFRRRALERSRSYLAGRAEQTRLCSATAEVFDCKQHVERLETTRADDGGRREVLHKNGCRSPADQGRGPYSVAPGDNTPACTARTALRLDHRFRPRTSKSTTRFLTSSLWRRRTGMARRRPTNTRAAMGYLCQKWILAKSSSCQIRKNPQQLPQSHAIRTCGLPVRPTTPRPTDTTDR